jgi:hypothetical protein
MNADVKKGNLMNFNDVDRSSSRPNGHRLKVKAQIVVLAAGGYSSSVVWLRSKLPNGSGMVGKNFLCNPNTFLYGLYNQEIKLWENIPAATAAILGQNNSSVKSTG